MMHDQDVCSSVVTVCVMTAVWFDSFAGQLLGGCWGISIRHSWMHVGQGCTVALLRCLSFPFVCLAWCGRMRLLCTYVGFAGAGSGSFYTPTTAPWLWPCLPYAGVCSPAVLYPLYRISGLSLMPGSHSIDCCRVKPKGSTWSFAASAQRVPTDHRVKPCSSTE